MFHGLWVKRKLLYGLNAILVKRTGVISNTGLGIKFDVKFIKVCVVIRSSSKFTLEEVDPCHVGSA